MYPDCSEWDVWPTSTSWVRRSWNDLECLGYVPWHFWKFLKGKAFKNAKKDIRQNGNLFRWQTKTKIGHSFGVMMCNATMERSRTLGGILDFFKAKERCLEWWTMRFVDHDMISLHVMSILFAFNVLFCFWMRWMRADRYKGREGQKIKKRKTMMMTTLQTTI